METKNFGKLLLHDREKLFSSLYEGKDLSRHIADFAGRGLLFAALYGLVLGFFCRNAQILSAAVKVPLLLFGTIAICLPTLYTFNVLLGSRLSFRQTLSVLLMSNYLLCMVLVSFAPITLFLSSPPPINRSSCCSM